MLTVLIENLGLKNEGKFKGKQCHLPDKELENKILDITFQGENDYVVSDYTFPAGSRSFPIEEYDIINLNDLLLDISPLTPEKMKLISLLSNCLDSVDDVRDCLIEERYRMHENVESMVDVAMIHVEENVDLTNVPKIIKENIDYESMGLSLATSGDYWEFKEEKIIIELFH